MPAIFISSPDAESALAVVNGKAAVEEGRGLEMFYYTVYGGFVSLLPVIFISLLSLKFLESFYGVLEVYMHYVLLFFLLFIVLDSEDSVSAFIIAVFSGVLGVVSFESAVNQSFVFIPIFSGLFAFPAIIRSIDQDFQVPDQDRPELEFSEVFSGGFTGSLAGFIAGVIPGIGAAVATVFVSPLMKKDSSGRFMSALGAVNTTDIIFSIFTLYILGNARSGVSVALQFFSTEINLVYVLAACLVSAPVAAFIAIRISEVYVKILHKLPITTVLVSVLLLVSSLTLYMTGFRGLVILVVASLIGRAALITGNRRVCMSVLIIPALLFFSGAGVFI